jgi:hypothetical protein
MPWGGDGAACSGLFSWCFQFGFFNLAGFFQLGFQSMKTVSVGLQLTKGSFENQALRQDGAQFFLRAIA